MSETIGSKLKQAREGRDLNLEQVAATTRIRQHYLQALERDDLSAIPSAAQARGFLRLYAEFLGLDPDQLVESARQAEPSPVAASESELTTDSTQKMAPAPAATRPGFLASLLERFTRRAGSPASAESAAPALSQQPAPKPEAFVPARYTEELPAEPSSLAETAALEEPEPALSVEARKAGSRGSAPRKSASKAAKSAASGAGRKTGEKKKIT